MGAPRWTEQPKEAGPIEKLRVPVVLADGRIASRGLPWDPGGGWGTDDEGNDATSWAVNIAVPRTKVLWGSTEDLGPNTVGGKRNVSPKGERLPGQFFEGERIVIPIPDDGGSLDIQTWGAFDNTSLGEWEWGRVNIRGEAAIRNFNFPPLSAGPPPPPPPPVETAKTIAQRALADLRASNGYRNTKAQNSEVAFKTTFMGKAEQGLIRLTEIL